MVNADSLKDLIAAPVLRVDDQDSVQGSPTR